jgi:hypothetical protein
MIMNAWPLGVSGVYSAYGDKKVHVGPVLASNALGKVFCDIEKTCIIGNVKYLKGASMWLDPTRIVWKKAQP